MQENELSQKIIEYLEKETSQKLPNFGYIAGQSVAEAYFRIMDIPIYTRIRDVDLFFNTAELDLKDEIKKYTNEVAMNYCNESSYLFVDHTIGVTNSDSYKNTEENNIITSKITNNYLYIKNSIELGRLNIVNFYFSLSKYGKKYTKQDIDKIYLKELLKYFDINSVKIGICLETKQLILDDEFKKFIKTRNIELNLTNLFSQKSFKAYIRMLEKYQYYKGVYFNKEYELNLAYIIFKLAKKDKEIILNKQFKALSQENKKYFQKFLTITPHKDFYRIKKLYLKSNHFDLKVGTIIGDGYELNRILLKTPTYVKLIDLEEFGKIYKDKQTLIKLKENYNPKISQKVKNYINNSFKFLNNKNDMFILEENRKEDVILFFSKKITNLIELKPKPRLFNKNVKENLKLFKTLKSYNYYYFNNNIIFQRDFLQLFFTKKIKEIINKNIIPLLDRDIKSSLKQLLNKPKSFFKPFFKHDSLFTKYRFLCNGLNETVDYQLFHDRINYIEHLEMEIIGVIEMKKLEYIFLENEEVFKKYIQKILKYIKRKNTELKQKKTPDIFIIPSNILNFKDYKIIQITNGYDLEKEGKTMHHCVGGFIDVISSGKIIVFSVFDNKNNRYTLAFEVKKKSNKKSTKIVLNIYDFKLKYNKEPKRYIRKDMNLFLKDVESYLNKRLNERIEE